MAEPKIKTIQAKFGFQDPDLKKPAHDDIIKWLDGNIEEILMVLFKLDDRPDHVRTKWEAVVRTQDNRQFIGFIDLKVTARLPVFENERYCGPENFRILFEAKTVLGTLGELFRQLQLYREGYMDLEPLTGRKNVFVVVCPDDSEARLIEQQGFRFLKYDPAMAFPAGGV